MVNRREEEKEKERREEGGGRKEEEGKRKNHVWNSYMELVRNCLELVWLFGVGLLFGIFPLVWIKVGTLVYVRDSSYLGIIFHL